MDLKGKVIAITGAAQGLGEKMAESLAAEGVNLALVDVDDADLKKPHRRDSEHARGCNPPPR